MGDVMEKMVHVDDDEATRRQLTVSRLVSHQLIAVTLSFSLIEMTGAVWGVDRS